MPLHYPETGGAFQSSYLIINVECLTNKQGGLSSITTGIRPGFKPTTSQDKGEHSHQGDESQSHRAGYC